MRIALGIGVALGIVAIVYFTPSKPPDVAPETQKSASVSILFVGDMFFDRTIRTMMERVGGDYIFSCIYPLLAQSDFVVGNLEGPITEHASVSQGTKPGDPDNMRFTFPVQTAELLKRHNISVVSLGNNHISNFGIEGMHTTRTHLDAAGVEHFGGIINDEPILQKDGNGIPLSFISYNQFGGDAPHKVAEKIVTEKAAGRTVIVYAHWGEEYIPPTESMRASARLFAESGASAVIGSHPHVVQESEYIGDTLVYYSLGNFIFDQYHRAATARGLMTLIHFSTDNEKPSVTEYPVITQTDGRTCEAVPLALR